MTEKKATKASDLILLTDKQVKIYRAFKKVGIEIRFTGEPEKDKAITNSLPIKN